MGRYYDEGKFHSWLFKIAYNTFLNHLSAVRPSLSLDEASKVRAGEAAVGLTLEKYLRDDS